MRPLTQCLNRLRSLLTVIKDSACLVLIGCVPPTASGRAQPVADLVIYEARGTDILEIFNPRTGDNREDGRAFLTTRQATGDIGGLSELCSTSAFYCMSEPVVIAVPKSRITASWSVAGLHCRRSGTVGTKQQAVYSIECRDSYGSAASVTYSRSKGVISFIPKCKACDGTRFDLIGERGLFAAMR
jgi:hypothetical protein